MTWTRMTRPALRLAFTVALAPLVLASTAAAQGTANMFGNPSFEQGRGGWNVSRAGETECRMAVDQGDAADGLHSALVTVGSIESWGVQFGQAFAAGELGQTYTFAVFAKSAKGPVDVDLQIERSAQPYDRAAASETFRLGDQWRELHLTFKVEKVFQEGWTAYLSCTQPNVQFRADMFRLSAGNYVPYERTTQDEAGAAMVRLFDTTVPAPGPVPGRNLSRRPGWTLVAEDNTTHTFAGDAVLTNDRIACVLRRGAPGVELYSVTPGSPTLRAVLTPTSGLATQRLTAWTVSENSPGSGTLEATFTAGNDTLTVRCGLKMGQAFVQTDGGTGATNLRVQAPSRFAVLPDFFADDIVVDAAELPVQEADLPSDSFLLHLLPDRQAIVMTVTKAREEEIRITLAGRGQDRLIGSSEIPYGKDGVVWVGVLADPGIWHMQEVAEEQAGDTIRLDWKSPFAAQWRVDWRCDNGLSDSWEMVSEKADGSYTKYGMFGGAGSIPASRKRWTTVLGTFEYPCWVNRSGQGFLEPLKSTALRFRGPAILYPINRSRETGLDKFTVVDIVRSTLGVGPCEYILDLEGQQSKSKGRATCSVRDTLNPIYAAGKQKQQRKKIEKVLEDLMIFITFIRERIDIYVDFGHETLDYLAQQKQEHPELSKPLTELETLARVIDAKVDARRSQISTPTKAAKTVETFRRTVLDYDGKDALARCKTFTEAWVVIGGNQDHLAGECRWAVKALRQKAGLLMAIDPRVADVANEIRKRGRIVLRNPAGHEAARH